VLQAGRLPYYQLRVEVHIEHRVRSGEALQHRPGEQRLVINEGVDGAALQRRKPRLG